MSLSWKAFLLSKFFIFLDISFLVVYLKKTENFIAHLSLIFQYAWMISIFRDSSEDGVCAVCLACNII